MQLGKLSNQFLNSFWRIHPGIMTLSLPILLGLHHIHPAILIPGQKLTCNAILFLVVENLMLLDPGIVMKVLSRIK
jgi:hypothetical protein